MPSCMRSHEQWTSLHASPSLRPNLCLVGALKWVVHSERCGVPVAELNAWFFSIASSPKEFSLLAAEKDEHILSVLVCHNQG